MMFRTASPLLLRTTTKRMRLSGRCLTTTPQFSSPKVAELYHQLIAMDHEERKLVAKTALLRIGVDIDKETARREAFLAEQALAPVAVEVVAEEAPQAKTAVDLRLVSFDDKAKIKVIKEVRAMTNLGLKEAKELVEGAPTVIKRQIKPEEAEELKAKLVEVGAQIEIA